LILCSNMIALRISLNGKSCCTAGAKDLEVLTAILTAKGKLGPHTAPVTARAKPGFHRSVRGLTARNNGEGDDNLHWTTPSVCIGDSLTIEIIETTLIEKPRSTEKIGPAIRSRRPSSRRPSKRPNRRPS
jgi:hypothetical protein